MNDKNKPFVHVQFGDDGNPEVKVAGSMGDQGALCIVLMAGLAMMYGANDPTKVLMFLMTSAAELVDQLEDDDED